MRLSMTWVVSLILLLIGSVWSEPGMTFALAMATELLKLLPLILFVAILAGWATTGHFVDKLREMLDQRPIRGIVIASVIGAITPVCGIAVAPIIATLLRQGIPLAVAMAFWLSSPISDPGMMILTAGILGWSFALAKLAAALLLGMTAGAVALGLEKRFPGAQWLRDDIQTPSGMPTCTDNGRSSWLSEALHTFWLVARWLTLALIVEGILRSHLNEAGIASLIGADSNWAVPLAVAVGGPLYIESYAALPLLRGLIDAGLSPGAAMAFLISGATISFYAAVAVWSLVRPAIFGLYLTLGLASALVAGWVVDGIW